MRILGLIPARGGSKGIPRKNIRPIEGRSLVQRAFECAQASGVVDRVWLSTDDAEIAAAARGFGLEVPYLRPAELARDESPMIDVVIHALNHAREGGVEPDAVLLLQPTAPLRRPEHLREAVAVLGDFDSVASVVPLPQELCPHFVLKITPDGRLDFFMPDGVRYTRRQDVPPAYRRDGTVYLARSSVIREHGNLYGRRCRPMILDPADSLTLDHPADWDEAERRLAGR